MQKFIYNFSVALLGYLIINFIGYLMRSAYYPEMGINNLLPSGVPSCILNLGFIILLVLHIAIISVLYFTLGRNLDLFDSQLLNYLSVCGSFILSIVILYYNLRYIQGNTQLMFDVNASFGMVWNMVTNALNKYRIGYYVMAIMPSIITWLGMLYQSKKI